MGGVGSLLLVVDLDLCVWQTDRAPLQPPGFPRPRALKHSNESPTAPRLWRGTSIPTASNTTSLSWTTSQWHSIVVLVIDDHIEAREAIDRQDAS